MPFYEYECANCKFYTELLQKVSDPPLRKCPSCGRSTMKKLVSAPNFRLKGGGWYETDFKSDKETKRNLAGEEKAEKSDKSESSDSKPAAKPVAASPEKPAAKTAAKPGRASKPAAKKPTRAPAKKAAKRR